MDLRSGISLSSIANRLADEVRSAIKKNPDIVLLMMDSDEERQYMALYQTLSCLREFAKTHK